MKSRSASSTADSVTNRIESRYCGRFAPSPTGPLHLGSLVTAVASFLDARAHHGEWQLRIEDIDGPRTVDGAADAIRNSLVRHGLEWDGEIVRQSTHADRYDHAIAELRRLGMTFRCRCSRSALSGDPIYPGTCRRNPHHDGEGAIRVRARAIEIAFEDRIQGGYAQHIERDVGDFVIRRRDGLYAYQLAVSADDGDGRITHVVRGADLLDNTPRQLYLMQLLGLDAPIYAHVPVLLGADGTKLSKQTGARSIEAHPAGENVWLALTLLGQSPPATLRGAIPNELLDWATRHWRIDDVPRTTAITNFLALC